MPSFLAVFGYVDPTATFGYGISTNVQQLISSLMSLGAVVGCAIVGPLSRYLSRRWCLVIAICFNQLGVVLMIASTNLAALYAGRLIVGIANGLFDVFPQLYIHECAPSHLRGPLLGMFNVLVSVGLLVGTIVDNYTSTMTSKAGYQIPLGLFFIAPMILLFALPFMPDSPRWLFEYKNRTLARNALVKLRNNETSSHVIDAELEEIKVALDTEREMAQGVRFFDMFKGTNLRRSLLSIAMICGLGACGSLFFLAYGTYFFAIAGQTAAFAETVGMTAAGLAATLFSMWLITKVGRRVIFMIGFSSQAICMLVVAITWSVNATSTTSGRVMVSFAIIYIWFYNMCTAPYLYLAAGEIPTQRLRSYTLGITIGVGFFWNWLVVFTAPYFLNPTALNWVCAHRLSCYKLTRFRAPNTVISGSVRTWFASSFSSSSFPKPRIVRSRRLMRCLRRTFHLVNSRGTCAFDRVMRDKLVSIGLRRSPSTI
jgi:MFS transporter, SP family, sugar:H+ symporter